jgi:hypothetical protein
MLGFGKKNKQPQDGTQIPYQVYETVQGSSPARWPRLVLAGILALGILVLIVFGGIKLYRNISDNYSGDGPSGTAKNGQTADSKESQKTDDNKSDENSQPKSDPAKTQQSPQNNPSIPKPNGDPATTSQSGSTNNSKIDGPE